MIIFLLPVAKMSFYVNIIIMCAQMHATTNVLNVQIIELGK